MVSGREKFKKILFIVNQCGLYVCISLDRFKKLQLKSKLLTIKIEVTNSVVGASRETYCVSLLQELLYYKHKLHNLHNRHKSDNLYCLSLIVDFICKIQNVKKWNLFVADSIGSQKRFLL